MRKLTTGAIGAACLVLGAGGATLYTHAATGPAIYNVYEANVTDEDAYKKALPEVQKIIKENSGVYLAGGFNKAKVDFGKSEIGNRYVSAMTARRPTTSSGAGAVRHGSKSTRRKPVA